MDGGSSDAVAVGRDLVRALRGDRSQVAFARRLGYRSNAVYTWESGRRWLSASAFLRAAERVGIDVRAGVAAFLRADGKDRSELLERGAPEWIGDLEPRHPSSDEGVEVCEYVQEQAGVAAGDEHRAL